MSSKLTLLDLPNEIICLVFEELKIKEGNIPTIVGVCSLFFELTINDVLRYLRMMKYYEHNFIDFDHALHVSQRFPDIPLSVKTVTNNDESYLSTLMEENRMKVRRTYDRYKEYENLGITDAFYDETELNSEWHDYYDDPGWETEFIVICTYKNNKMYSYDDQPALVVYEYNHHPRYSQKDFCLVEEKWYKDDKLYREGNKPVRTYYDYDGNVRKNKY